MGELPTVCVIGAGVSGLTACKALADSRHPPHVLRGLRRGRRQLVLRKPQRDLLGVPLAAHRHLQALDLLRGLPDARRATPTTRTTRTSSSGCATTPTRSPCASGSASTRASPAPSAGPAAAGRSRSADGASERFDALLVCNGHHWDPRYPDFPGTFDGPAIHSHDYIDPSTPLDLYGKRVLVVGIGNSAVDIVSELGRKTVSDTVFLSTRSGAWVVPKYIFGKPADQVFKTNPRLPVGLQRRLARVLPRIFSGRMEDFGLPTPNHNFLDAHPTVSSELLGRLGSGDAVAKGDVAELLGDRVRFADGSVEPVDAIIYATGYKVSFPFFDPEFLSAPENVLPLYKRMLQAGDRRPRVHRPGPADPHDLPVRRAAVEARRALARRRLGAARASTRWKPRSRATRSFTSATSSTSPGTRCSSSGTRSRTSCARARSPRARRGRGPGRRPGAQWRGARRRSQAPSSGLSRGVSLPPSTARVSHRQRRAPPRRLSPVLRVRSAR